MRRIDTKLTSDRSSEEIDIRSVTLLLITSDLSLR